MISSANQREWPREVLGPELLARVLDSGVHLAPQDSVADSWANLRDEDVATLRNTLRVARALETSAPGVVPSPVWRLRARHRLLAAIDPVEAPTPSFRARARARLHWLRSWYAQTVTALAAASFVGVATAHASTSALPGDLLYPVKEVTEDVALRMADSEPSRAHILIYQAEARLDETAELVRLGRMNDAVASAQRYQDSVALAVAAEKASGEAWALTPSGAKVAEEVQAKLTVQASEALALLDQASGPADALLDGATRGLAQLAAPAAHPDVLENPGSATPVVSEVAPEPEPGAASDVSDSGHSDGESAAAIPTVNQEQAGPPPRASSTGVPAGRLPPHASSTQGANVPETTSSSPDDVSADASRGESPAALLPSQVANQSPVNDVQNTTRGAPVGDQAAADAATTNQAGASSTSPGASPNRSPGQRASTIAPPSQAANTPPSKQAETTTVSNQGAGATPPSQGANTTAPPSQAANTTSRNQAANTSAPPSQATNITPSKQAATTTTVSNQGAGTTPPSQGHSTTPPSQGANVTAPPSQAANTTSSNRGANNTLSTQTGRATTSPGQPGTTSPTSSGQSGSSGTQAQTASKAAQSQSNTPGSPASLTVNSSTPNKPPVPSKP